MDSFESIVARNKQKLEAKRNAVAQQAAARAAKERRVAELVPKVLRDAQRVAKALSPIAVGHPAMETSELSRIELTTRPKWHDGGMSGHNTPPSKRAYRRAERQFEDLTHGRTFPVYDLEHSYTWHYQYSDDESSFITETYGIGQAGSIYWLQSRGLTEYRGIYGVTELRLQQRQGGDHEERLEAIHEGLGFVVAKYNLQLEK